MDSPFIAGEEPAEVTTIGMSRKSRVITSVKELPPWDTIFNAVGQPLGEQAPPKDILVLGVQAEHEASRKVYVLASPEGRKSPRHAALLVRLLQAHYAVFATLIAEASVLQVILSEWSAGHDAAQLEDQSAAHAQWDAIIEEANKLGASDVHLRATLGRAEFLYRINGELEPKALTLTQEQGMALAASMYNSMVDKGSTSDGFNPRASQSASVTRTLPSGRMRLRFESLPVEPDGINVTLRLIPLGVTTKRKTPEELGYSPDQSETLRRIFARSSGLILFLGTTGSGKSTSMAHALMGVVQDRPGKMLRTVEEPVEIRIPGNNVSQTSVARSAADGDEDPFIAKLRSLLRSDPDYIMVGELRDAVTANLGIQAVRSGHLCVSTLHADGAPMAYDRLSGMGISRVDLASVGLIAGLIYQRLVPMLCDRCKVPASKVADLPEYQPLLGRLATYMRKHRPDLPDYLDRVHFQNPDGCDACRRRGVIGRSVCAEILVPTSAMMNAIRNSDSTELWKLWRATGDDNDPNIMRGRTAFEHALWKMTQGIVSPTSVEAEFKQLDEEAFE